MHFTIRELFHGKNDFAKRSKILTGYTDQKSKKTIKIILLNQNNYVERLNWLLEYQNFFAALLIIFKILAKLF